MKELGNSNNNDGGSSGGCPVAKDATVDSSSDSRSSGWGSWLGWSAPKPAATDATVSAAASTNSGSNGCPVAKDDQQQPASLEEAARHAQTPHPDQKGVALSTHRMISSIPRGATEDTTDKGPHHQATTAPVAAEKKASSNWIYPSEQQFFNALRKKGWNDVQAEEIPSVLEIHNTVNERTWKQVIRWEEGMDRDIANTSSDTKGAVETDLKLVRFQGRPKDLSPQAFIWTTLLRQMEAPFDRHDWYVQKQPRRQPGSSDHPTSSINAFPIQRYVIDYYMIPPSDPNIPPTPYVDARPALDSPRAFYLRASRLIQQELPGLTSEYRAWKARQPQYFDGSMPMSSTATTS